MGRRIFCLQGWVLCAAIGLSWPAGAAARQSATTVAATGLPERVDPERCASESGRLLGALDTRAAAAPDEVAILPVLEEMRALAIRECPFTIPSDDQAGQARRLRIETALGRWLDARNGEPANAPSVLTLALIDGLAIVLRSSDDMQAPVLLYRQRIARLGPNPPTGPVLVRLLEGLTHIAAPADPLGQTESPTLQLLAIREETLGPDNPATLATVSRLAMTYLPGRPLEAVPLFLRLHAAAVRAGDAERATIYAGALAACFQREAGARARSASADLNNFDNLVASARSVADDAGPRIAYQLAVATLGREHPATLIVLSQLAAAARDENVYQELLAVQERIDGPGARTTTATAGDLAELHFRRGRYAEAEALQLRVIATEARLSGENDIRYVRALVALALTYAAQGRDDDLGPLLIRANDLNARLGAGRGVPASQIQDAIAAWRLRTGDYAGAATLYAQLAAQQDRERFQGRNLLILRSLAGLGEAERRRGRTAEADQAFDGALRELRTATETELTDPFVLRFRLAYAEHLQARGRNDEAAELARTLQPSFDEVLGRNHPATLSLLAVRATALLSRSPDRSRALAALDAAFTINRRLQPGSGSLEAEVFAQQQRRREGGQRAAWFGLFADALWTGSRFDEGGFDLLRPLLPQFAGNAAVFEALQQSQLTEASASVVAMAARRAAQARGEALAALVREREEVNRALIAALDLFSLSLGDAPVTDEQRQTFNAERTALEQRLALLDARLRAEFPDYFALTRPSPATLFETHRALRRNEALLLVVPTRFGTHVMAVTADRVVWRRSDWTEERIVAAAARLRSQAASPEPLRPGGYPGFDRATAHALYRELFGGLSDVLTGRDRLIIVRAGSLAPLPFSVLVTEPPQGADDDPTALSTTAWLGERFGLVQVPSIQALVRLRALGQEPDGEETAGFVGFGNPVLDGAPVEAGRAAPARTRGAAFVPATGEDGRAQADVRTLRSLSRLPGTEVELRRLRAMFGPARSRVYAGADATEPNVRSADAAGILRRASVIGFATHGLTEEQAGDVAEPGLVLTPPADATGPDDDGYLAASEVAGLTLDANWVLLSACNTATGASFGGDGLSALSRSFLYAGARSLIASLWLVGDEVAPAVTVGALSLQRSGVPRAEALRRAVRDVRMSGAHGTSWAHPYYWAPFVLIGEGG